MKEGGEWDTEPREAAGATNEDNVVDVCLLRIGVLRPPSREDLADEVVAGLSELARVRV